MTTNTATGSSAPRRAGVALFHFLVFLLPFLASGNMPGFEDPKNGILLWETGALLLWAAVTTTRPIGLGRLLGQKKLWPLPLFGLAIIVSAAFSVVPQSGISTAMLWLTLLLFASTAVQLRLTGNEIRSAVAAYFISGVCIALYGIYQSLWGLDRMADIPGLSETDARLIAGERRSFSVFPGTNIFGGFLQALLPLAAALIMGSKSRIYRLLTAIGLFVVIAALLLSQSRGAILCVILGLFPAALLLFKNRRRVLLIAAATVILGSVFFFGLSFEDDPERNPALQSVIDRFYALGSNSDSSIRARLAYWQSAIAMGNDHFPIGAGPGNFPELARKYQVIPNYTRSVHNFPIQLYAETGIFGLLFFLAAYATALSSLRKSVAGRGNLSAWIALSASMMLLHSLMDIDFDVSPALFGAFWLMLAFLWIPKIADRPDRDSGKSAVARTLAATAIVILLFAGQFMPRMSDNFYRLSLLAGQTGSTQKAMELNEKALSIWPVSYAANYRMSRLLMERSKKSANKSDLEASRQYLTKAISLNPANPEFHVGRADIDAMSGQQDKALEDLRQAHLLFPVSIHYQTEYARGLALSGNNTAALSELNDALHRERLYLHYLCPDSIELFYARFLRAAILNEQKRYQDSMKEYDNIIKLCDAEGLNINSYTSARIADFDCNEIKIQARNYQERVRKAMLER